MVAEYLVQVLGEDHDLGSFECGDEKLDAWLRGSKGAQDEGTVRVFVVLEANEVIGFFALTTSQLQRQQMPRSSKSKRDSSPVMLLAKLAVASSRQGTGVGAFALEQALRASLQAADLVGGVFLVVDVPNPDRREFYVRHGFVPTSKTASRHYMKMTAVREVIAGLDS